MSFFHLIIVALCAFVAICDAQKKEVRVSFDQNHGAFAGEAPLTLLPLDTEAACLDGSPYGFYFVPSTTNSTKWTVSIQGGGWCYDEDLCLSRASTRLGSSTKWATTSSCGCMNADVDGLISDCNCIFMPYCDGASFSGYRESNWPVPNESGKNLTFRGIKNLDATIQWAFQNTNLAEATEFVLTGGSAGGLSTFLHSDRVAAAIRKGAPHIEKIVAAPVVGYFRDVDNFQHTTGTPNTDSWVKANYTSWMKYIFAMQNLSFSSDGGLMEACREKHADEPWLCFMSPHMQDVIETPFFVFNSKYDAWQLANEFQSAWTTKAEQDGVLAYGAGFLHDFDPVKADEKNGAFITSCICHGCPWQSPTALSYDGGPSPYAAYGAWYAGKTRGASAIHIDPRLPNGNGTIDDASCSSFPDANVRGIESPFRLSNTLGDGMVLSAQGAIVWGFGTAGTKVTTEFAGTSLSAAVSSDGVWRIKLPVTTPSHDAVDLLFSSSDGASTSLKGVLFGEVFLCGGQSNMQYTPRSMAGMNNMSAEILTADAYPSMRLFTVGQSTKGGNPLDELASIEEGWTVASSAAVGATAWQTFSAVCYLFGRNVADALDVPIGLVSNNWGGTSVQSWSSNAALSACNATTGSDLYNPMIHPYVVGPMRFDGTIWYQGEANVGHATYYACQITEMIKGWRSDFANDDMYFGFVQIAGYNYGEGYTAGDLRQAQLAPYFRLQNVGLSTAIDTGDFVNIHPPDKQNPARRLSDAYLKQVHDIGTGTTFAIYAGSNLSKTVLSDDGETKSITVIVRLSGVGATGLTVNAPVATTQSTTLGQPGSVPRNMCVTANPAFNATAGSCGYPTIYGIDPDGTATTYNATLTISDDGSALELRAIVTSGFEATATSYGRASWPTVGVFNSQALPVIPWYAPIGSTSLPMSFPS